MTEDYDATHLPGLGSYPVETQLYRSSDMNHCLAFGRRTVVLAGKKLGSLRYEVGLLLGDLQGLRRRQTLRLVDLLFHRQHCRLIGSDVLLRSAEELLCLEQLSWGHGRGLQTGEKLVVDLKVQLHLVHERLRVRKEGGRLGEGIDGAVWLSIHVSST